MPTTIVGATGINKIQDGTVVDADIDTLAASKLTGALPALNGANLTSLTAANIAGTLPAISGANLTNLPISGKLNLSGGAMTGAITTNSTFDGVDIAVRDAILTSTTTTAGAALPKAGGSMTGILNITTSGTGMTFNTPSTGQNSWITWKDGGTSKWEINKNTANNFNIYSYAYGSNVITLKETGKIGIGTTSPSSARGIAGSTLHISHGTDAALRITDTGGSDFEISAETITSMGTVDATDLAIITNNTERMRIQSDGTVGIGVNNPVARLQIKSAGGGSESALKVTDNSSNDVFIVQGGGKAYFNYGPLGLGTTTPDSGSAMTIVHPGSSKYGLRYKVHKLLVHNIILQFIEILLMLDI